MEAYQAENGAPAALEMVVYGRATYYLKAGETIYYNSIVPHYVGAHGDDPAQLLAVTYTP